MEKDIPAEVVILIPDKIDHKSKAIIKDKERHHILIKGSIHQEDILMKIHTANNRAPNYMNQK